MINLQTRINAFVQLGNKIQGLTEDEKNTLAQQAANKNSWFTAAHVDLALNSITSWLEYQKLVDWVQKYPLGNHSYRVGIVMAGNIPLVGFHDFLSVLICGHIAVVKLSSQDNILPLTIANWLIEIDSEFTHQIKFVDKLTNIDAVIATGSDNSARYFHQYFNHLPNIIRKNRTSYAIIKGDESIEDLSRLGNDIFSYFGLGCRNVSKILVPKGYDVTQLLDGLETFSDVLNHHKYSNNYDYNKSIYLVNRDKHFDNGFLLLKPSTESVSPLAVLFYEEYDNLERLSGLIDSNSEKLQCIVSTEQWYPDSIDFGKAQTPELEDYADGVDTMLFLSELSND